MCLIELCWFKTDLSQLSGSLGSQYKIHMCKAAYILKHEAI